MDPDCQAEVQLRETCLWAEPARVDGCTYDSLLGGRVKLHQSQIGYRANMDSLLLASTVPESAAGNWLELGSGNGAVLLCAAARCPNALWVGVESDPSAAALCRTNIEMANRASRLRGLTERLQMIEADLRALPSAFGEHFEGVLMNPPFTQDPATTRPPRPERRHALINSVPLEQWILTAHWALQAQGTLILIHQASMLGEILQALTPSFGAIDLVPVFGRAERPAKRILLRARKSRKTQTKLLAPLYLQQSGLNATKPSAEARELWLGGGFDWNRAMS